MPTQRRRTRSAESTATEFAHGCVASKGMHDADLCDRIRTLEREVEQLRVQKDHCHCHHWHWSNTSIPYTTWSGTTTGTWSTGKVITDG